MQYCNLHNNSDGLFLGYFALLSEVLSRYPEGVPEGSYFVNGETLSIWVWNNVEREWLDTNRSTQTPLTGVVDDPSTYRPDITKGIKSYFLYITPPAKNICFTYFLNGNEPLRVTVTHSSVISLFWDGDFWHLHSVPLRLEAYQSKAYTDFRFQLTDSENVPPEVERLSKNPGDAWIEQIPETVPGMYLWMINVKLDGNGDFFDEEIGWSVPVRLTGDRGSTGPQGENSYCMVLSNDSHTVPCQKDGSGGHYDGAHTTCYVFEGSVDISPEYTFYVLVSEGIEYTTGNNNRTVIVSGMVPDSGTVTFIAECFGKPALQKVFSLAKSKQGFDGDPAVTYRISVSDIVVRKTAAGLRVPELLTAESFSQTANEVPVLYPAYFKVEGIKADKSRMTLLSATSAVSSVSFPTLEGYESFEITLYKNYSSGNGFQNRLDRENIPVLCDGIDGVGVKGAVLRPRGEWSSTKIYGCFDSYRDVVIYGTDRKYYVAKENIGSIPKGTLPTNTVYWDTFNDYENIATGLLLANNAYIDILGSNGIRVGNYPNCWELAEGAISHRVSGLTLTSDGVLSDPDGLHIKIGNNTLVNFTDNKISTSVTETKVYIDNKVDGIQIDGRNLVLQSDQVFTARIATRTYNMSKTWLSLKGKTVSVSFDYNYINATTDASNRMLWFEQAVSTDAGVSYALSTGIRLPVTSTPISGSGRFTGTLVVPSNIVSTYTTKAAMLIIKMIGGSGTITNFKIEEGNKATDWTPAPEDVQADIDSKVATTVYESGITQLSTQISSKVSQTDFNALGNRVSATESEILQTPNKISLAVNNIQIGGRNLLKNSAMDISTGWALTWGSSFTTFDGYKCLKTGYDSRQTYWGAYSSLGAPDPLPAGTTYTASIDVYATAPVSFAFGFEGNWKYASIYESEINRWVRKYITAVSPASSRAIVIYPGHNATSGNAYFKNYKVEIGNKPTAWTPAPEDEIAALVRTGIDIEAGTITLDAAKTVVTGALIVKGIENGGINVGGNCIISSTGYITAKGATIEGKVTATSGAIGGVNINGGYLGIDASNSSTSNVGSFFAAKYLGLRSGPNYFRVDTGAGNALQATIRKTSDVTAALSIENTSSDSSLKLGTCIESYGSNYFYGYNAVQFLGGSSMNADTTNPYLEVSNQGVAINVPVNAVGPNIARYRGYLVLQTTPGASGSLTAVYFRRA